MPIPTIITLVGATGGTGTTRLSLEPAAALVTDGRDMAVFDVAFATQGFSDYVSGALDPDATALVTDAADVPLESGPAVFKTDAEGRVAVCPAVAPFGRLARAMMSDAARVFEGRIAEAADGFNHVLVDVPLLASNQTAATAAACDRVALVAPATDRGADAVDRLSARVADIDTDTDAVVSTFSALDGTDVVVPETEATGLVDTSACREDAELVTGVAAVVEVFLDIEINAVTVTDGALGSVSEYVRR